MYLRGLSAAESFFTDEVTPCPPGYAKSMACSSMDARGNCFPYAKSYRCVRTQSDSTGGGVGPISVTVSPHVSTQVNPQVSPVLVQQQQPTNSPVGASTSQSSSPAQQQSNPDIARQIAEQQAQARGEQQAYEDQQAARDAALYDAIMQGRAASTGGGSTSINVSAPPAATPIAETPTASIPTPFGPVSFPAESVAKTLPWLALGGFLIYIARKNRR